MPYRLSSLGRLTSLIERVGNSLDDTPNKAFNIIQFTYKTYSHSMNTLLTRTLPQASRTSVSLTRTSLPAQYLLRSASTAATSGKSSHAAVTASVRCSTPSLTTQRKIHAQSYQL
jgi:hypothetical protein